MNTLVAMEVFYRFSVRYLRTPSFTLRGVAGTRAVLIAITAVTALPFLFTYAPFMQQLFESRAIGLLNGVAIVGVGAALLVLLELEKTLRRWVVDPATSRLIQRKRRGTNAA